MERKGPFRKLWRLPIGDARAMRRVRQQIRQVARTDAPVLICGEPGSGKELVAKVIYQMSTRSDKPFVKVRCDEMSAELLERELFGHVRGAFAGARNAGTGSLETARGGTVFFDEIAALTPLTQSKLLRLLQEHEFEPLGSGTSVLADIRVLAATRRPLEELVRGGTFRLDLYYRLAVFPIQVPPLRKHRSDIPALVDYFITQHARLLSKTARGVSWSAMDVLKHHRWPGNVRELEACIEKALRASSDGWVRSHHLSLA